MKLDEAARRAGVHYQTVYRWVRAGKLAAHKIGGTYVVDEDHLARFLTRRLVPQLPPRQRAIRDWRRQQRRLERFLLDGDERNAARLVEDLHRSGVPVLDLCRRLLTPTLFDIGVRYERGDVTVAEEHRASAILERLMAPFFAHPKGRHRGVCLVTTPPGDQHSLPAMMAAAVLRADHWSVDHLATEVPPDDLVALAGRRGALVVLSVTYPPAAATADRLRRRLEKAGVPVLVGRPGADLADLLTAARTEAGRFL